MSFRIETEQLNHDSTLKRVIGPITLEADLGDLLRAETTTVVLDLAGVTRIDSLGVREWIIAINQSPPSQTVLWKRVAPPMCIQIGMISNFVGQGHIVSVILPWWCTTCERELTTEVTVAGYQESGLEPPQCPACNLEMTLDELDEGYLEAICEHAAH